MPIIILVTILLLAIFINNYKSKKKKKDILESVSADIEKAVIEFSGYIEGKYYFNQSIYRLL